MILVPIAAVLTLGSCLLAGCGPNLIGMVEHLSKSDRSWCLSAAGAGFDIKVGGSGVNASGGEGDMVCGSAGLTLKSQATQVGVPLTIVPQLSIGAPTLVAPHLGVVP